MLFVPILSVFAKTDIHTDAEAHFIEKLSLLHPHVSENGRNDFYNYDGHYLIKSRTRSDYSQLGYDHMNTAGIVQMKEPLKHRNFKFEIEFSLEPQQGGIGSGFWISEPLSVGEYYGRNSNFKGIGVIIDTKNRSFARFIDTSQPALNKTVNIKLSSKINELVLENIGNKLHVKLYIDGTEYLIYSGIAKINPSYVFGISHATGGSTSPLKINGIAGFQLAKKKPVYVKGEAPKSRKLVLFVGFSCILGLMYYLYTKQAKDISMKN